MIFLWVQFETSLVSLVPVFLIYGFYGEILPWAGLSVKPMRM